MKRALLILVVMVFSLVRSGWAYNFLYIHPTEGRPIGWEPGTTIKYYLDPGKLGRLTNEQAHTLLKEAMKIWENASPYANVPHFEFAGYLPEDVDGTNYGKYVSLFTCYTDDLASCPSEAQKNLQTVIVFDEDSAILDNELCQITTCSANAGAGVFSGSSQNPESIVQGIAVFGPKVVLESVPLTTIIPSTVGVMAHELGHLLGLAHSVVNQQVSIDEQQEENSYLPTMFAKYVPGIFAEGDNDSITLNPDDIAGIVNLYPTEMVSQELGTIKGQILKSDGSPMMHVNVIARNTEDPLCEAYSYLSGRICPEGFTINNGLRNGLCMDSNGQVVENGTFTLSGLPAGSYILEVEEIADDDLAQTLAPGLFDEFISGDAEFWNEGDGVSESNTFFSEIVLAAGETRENIDIILSGSTVMENRIKYLPLSIFQTGSATRCRPNTTDYSALIGLSATNTTTANDSVTTTGGCSLIPLR